MTRFATVVIPFAYTSRWGQIVISSLKKFKNDEDFDILVMNNSPQVPAINAITHTRLGDDVKIHTPENPKMRWHGGALDRAITLIDTPYMFSLETDCTVERDGWLDWYSSFLQDEYTSMVGWYWHDGIDNNDGRHYINSSATLYRTEVLRRLWHECMSNTDEMLCYGNQLEKRMNHETTNSMIRDKAIGPFSDSRGFFTVDYPCPLPDQWWHEPGCWIYRRMALQYQCKKVPGAIIKNPNGMQPQVKYNYYGEQSNPYLIHYWGGTVSHNYEKHLIIIPWEAMASEWWINRELYLWEKWVPEDIRKQSITDGHVRSADEEREYARKRTHILSDNTRIRIYRGDATPYITGEQEEPNIPDDGLPALMKNWEATGVRVIFDKAPEVPYDGQFEEGGKIHIIVHPARCVKEKK